MNNEPLENVGDDAFGNGFLNKDYAQRAVDKINRYIEVRYDDSRTVPDVSEEADKFVIMIPRSSGNTTVTGSINGVPGILRNVPGKASVL